jgi:hypothetical protein
VPVVRLAVVALLLGATQAVGEQQVVDLVSNTEHRVMTRLENELRALGYRVVRRRFEEPLTAGAWGEVECSAHRLVARVSMEQQTRVATFDDPNDDAVWAIRVTEWLRSDASLLRAPGPQVPPAPVERTSWRVEVSARGVARWSPEVGVGVGLGVGVAVWPWRAFGFEVTLPGLTWLEVSRGGLVAMVREVSGAVRGLTRLVVSERWSLSLGVGVGARHVFVQGVVPATGGFERVVAELSAVAAVQWRASASFFLEWRSEVGVGLPAIALEFGGRRVGLVGAPGFQTGLGGGFSW